MTDKETVWTEDEINAIKEHIVAALEQVIDPELGIDIVNLGLVYEVELYNGGQCVIKMTNNYGMSIGRCDYRAHYPSTKRSTRSFRNKSGTCLVSCVDNR